MPAPSPHSKRQPVSHKSPAVEQVPAPGTASRNAWLAFGLLVALVFLTYSNHFNNEFHFDDSHVVVNNPYIRDLANIPRFFADARTYSVFPTDQNYRPFISVSLAFDYWFGRGLKPFWFHVSTFCWFLVQLGLMLLLFRRILDAARPEGSNPGGPNEWAALFGTALYGLHTALAETVNYVMQRGDVFSTVAVISGLLVYISFPALRRYGAYLVIPFLGVFAKEPTAVFPAILFLWIWLFEEDHFIKSLIRCIPAAVSTGAAAVFVVSMQPASYNPGAQSALNYRLSQPAVLASYFGRFFLPVGLSADSDRVPYLSALHPDALKGFVFIACLIGAIFLCRQWRQARPIAFGLAWFVIACSPTSWVGLAEVENDHRMYFPFVGLALSVSCAAWLLVQSRQLPRVIYLPVAGLVLSGLALGAHHRNEVWKTDEGLWYDVTIKSPRNGRGLMNYGNTLMARGQYRLALDYFQRALEFTPNYSTLEINLGIVNAALGLPADAERHFNRAMSLDPNNGDAFYFFGRWLRESKRYAESVTALTTAIEKNPALVDARHVLMAVYTETGNAGGLRALSAATLALFPADSLAKEGLQQANSLKPNQTLAAASAEEWLNQSLSLFQAGKFPESLAAAQEALKLRPDYPEAWNNIMAAHNSMFDWDNAIAAGERALQLKPDFALAQNNLAWARSHSGKSPVRK